MTTTAKQFTTGDICWVGYGQLLHGRDQVAASTAPHATEEEAKNAILSEWWFWLSDEEQHLASGYTRKCQIISEEGDFETID